MNPTALLKDLVAIPSVNPGYAAPDRQLTGESRMVDYLEQWFKVQRIETERRHVAEGRENLLAHLSGKDNSRRVVLCSHTDTVQVEGMRISPFEPTLRDGRLYGRGSADDKGPLSAMMIALARQSARGTPACNLTLAATCGEEFNLLGARHLAASELTIDAIVVGEPTECKLIAMHKGVVRWKLSTTGIAVHGSQPQMGRNAIYQMAPIIGAIHDHALQLQRQPPHEWLATPTINIGIIRGGNAFNIVPDNCEIFIDRRLLPEEQIDHARSQLESALAGLEIEYELEQLIDYPPMSTDPDDPFIMRLRTVQTQLGIDPAPGGAHYGTDAGAFWGQHIPTPVIGPGSIAQAHTPDEFIELEQLERGVALYDALLQSLEADG